MSALRQFRRAAIATKIEIESQAMLANLSIKGGCAMVDASDADIKSVGDTEMRKFCTAIGELILWASLIDGQLNKAVLGMFALPEHPMIEPIIAHLDVRAKAELLKKRAKIIPSVDWTNKITNWVERAEKANAKRNIVAHHGVRVSDGEIYLHSDQLGKIISSLETSDGTLKAGEPMGIKDIKEWVERAREAYEEGMAVLENLDRFREAAVAKLAEAARAKEAKA
jgi:hypothetical protein